MPHKRMPIIPGTEKMKKDIKTTEGRQRAKVDTSISMNSISSLQNILTKGA